MKPEAPAARAHTIAYRFQFADGRVVELELALDPRTLLNLAPLPPTPPEWAGLDFHRCTNCPLDPARHAHCPTAARLVEPVAAMAQTASIEIAEVHVTVPERKMVKLTNAQDGLASLLGVYMSTSGCPVLAGLRPMVRFHLPFATEVETIFRAAASYLVGQFLRQVSGETPDWSLQGLADIYREVTLVNRTFANRLRAAAPRDASVNALVLLDVFAFTLPYAIDEKLGELRDLYSAWGGCLAS